MSTTLIHQRIIGGAVKPYKSQYPSQIDLKYFK